MFSRPEERVRRDGERSTADPIALLVSQDGALLERVMAAARPPWKVETCLDGRSCRDRLSSGKVGLVIVDDGALRENERGWLVDRIHGRAPDVPVVYIAARHTPELERMIRGRGVLCYTSRPLDGERLGRLLEELFRRRACGSSDASTGNLSRSLQRDS